MEGRRRRSENGLQAGLPGRRGNLLDGKPGHKYLLSPWTTLNTSLVSMAGLTTAGTPSSELGHWVMTNGWRSAVITSKGGPWRVLAARHWRCISPQRRQLVL